MRILVTGGAGFIGHHLVKLLSTDHEVIVLDNFDPVVHGKHPNRNVEGSSIVIEGSIENRDDCIFAIEGCEAVIHLAADVSVSASFDEPSRFVRTNSLGTAVLWEAIHRMPTVKHVVIASSMSVYGHGKDYSGVIEIESCRPESIYGLSKYESEQLSLLAGKLYNVGVTALRLWNTYGPGQSLTNAETGVVAIFASRLLVDLPPLIFDDGQQVRDFIHVTDVAHAFKQAIDLKRRGIFNVGTGRAVTIWDVASKLSGLLSNGRITPQLVGRKRPGDVRHCFPAIDLARRELDWTPQIGLDLGLGHYADWLLNHRTAAG